VGRVKRLSRQERQQVTRAALLDAAARMFVKRGFQGSSIEEICAEAGYTRGAFYANFASKQQLFVELLRDRLFTHYTAGYEAGLADPERVLTLRETGEMLAAVQAQPETRWLGRLWLECLAHAGRDEDLRELAATFWRGNRARGAELIRRHVPSFADDAKAISTAMIALDIGLTIQHFVDPEEAPLDLYPELYVLLFRFLEEEGGRPAQGATGSRHDGDEPS
jgi:AcrR family transcriptional regulator